MIDRIGADITRIGTPEGLIDACLNQIGAVIVDEKTRKVLVDFVAQSSEESNYDGRKHIAEVLQMVAATQEFQRS